MRKMLVRKNVFGPNYIIVISASQELFYARLALKDRKKMIFGINQILPEEKVSITEEEEGWIAKQMIRMKKRGDDYLEIPPTYSYWLYDNFILIGITGEGEYSFKVPQEVMEDENLVRLDGELEVEPLSPISSRNLVIAKLAIVDRLVEEKMESDYPN